MYRKGFTLLELIVAMAVIAVIMGLSVLGIQAVQRAQRDTTRRSYLEAINLHIQGYYGDNNTYPAVTISASPRTTVTIGPASANRTVTLQGAGIALAVGTNTSISGSRYCYFANASNTGYIVGVQLESGTFTYFGDTTLSASCANL